MTHQPFPDLLLYDRLAPMTAEIGFLEAECSHVVETWQRWHQPDFGWRGITATPSQVQGDLESLLLRLPPLAVGEAKRHLFVPTAGPWTAVFDNSFRGPDVDSKVAFLAGQFRCRGICVVAQPNTMRERQRPQRGRYGAVMLSVYGPDVEEPTLLPPSFQESGLPGRIGKLARVVSAMNDGGWWRFDLVGEPLPFEQPERYTARRVKDRFTFAMLRDYLAAMGIRAFDADFYAPDGSATLVELTGTHTLRELTLEEVQAEF